MNGANGLDGFDLKLLTAAQVLATRLDCPPELTHVVGQFLKPLDLGLVFTLLGERRRSQ